MDSCPWRQRLGKPWRSERAYLVPLFPAHSARFPECRPTRKHVQDAAAELGCAASPDDGRTSSVAVVAPALSKWFLSQVLGAAGDVFRESGYGALLYELGDRAQRQRFFGSRQMVGRSDGALVLTLDLTADELEGCAPRGKRWPCWVHPTTASRR